MLRRYRNWACCSLLNGLSVSLPQAACLRRYCNRAFCVRRYQLFLQMLRSFLPADTDLFPQTPIRACKYRFVPDNTDLFCRCGLFCRHRLFLQIPRSFLPADTDLFPQTRFVPANTDSCLQIRICSADADCSADIDCSYRYPDRFCLPIRICSRRTPVRACEYGSVPANRDFCFLQRQFASADADFGPRISPCFLQDLVHLNRMDNRRYNTPTCDLSC